MARKVVRPALLAIPAAGDRAALVEAWRVYLSQQPGAAPPRHLDGAGADSDARCVMCDCRAWRSDGTYRLCTSCTLRRM